MTRAPAPGVTSERRAQFDRTQFRARLAVVAVLTAGLAFLPAAGPNGPTAAVVVVGIGAGTAHFLARWVTGVPNPTGWLDLIAVVTATVAAAIAPDVWAAALLFQMLVLGGAVSFLPPGWTTSMGGWSVISMAVVAWCVEPQQATSMLVVATVFFPVLLSGSRRKQARIKRASHRMEAVAASLPMVVWEWDIGRHKMGAVVGRTEEVFGRSTGEVLARGLIADVHPHDRTVFGGTYDRLADQRPGGERAEIEYRYVRPDGTEVWLRDQATVARGIDGPVLRGVTIDITESRAKDLDLHRHRQIVERMPAVTIVLDHQHDALASTVVQVVDPIGWGPGPAVVGQAFATAFPELAAHAELAQAIDGLEPGGVAELGPFALTGGDGDERHVEVDAFPLPGRSVALLVNDVTDRELMMTRVRHQASHDDLTGLLNRAALLQAAADALGSGRHCTLLLIDLNDFKSINDTLGHLTCDHYLAVIGQRLHELAHDHEFVTRLGGDEFAMLLVDPSPSRTRTLIDDVVASCRQPVTLHGVPLAGSASVGVAEAPGDADTAESLLRCADLAMYHAKSHQAGASRYLTSM